MFDSGDDLEEITKAAYPTAPTSATSALRATRRRQAIAARKRRVVPAELSPNGKPLLVSNEVSGSLRVFEIAQKK